MGDYKLIDVSNLEYKEKKIVVQDKPKGTFAMKIETFPVSTLEFPDGEIIDILKWGIDKKTNIMYYQLRGCIPTTTGQAEPINEYLEEQMITRFNFEGWEIIN